MKKPAKSRLSHIAIRRWVLPFTLGLLVAMVTAQGFLIAQLLRQDQLQSNARISQLITESVDDHNRPLPQDIKNGAVFINEAKLTLPPAPPELGQLVYVYSPATQNSKPAVNIAKQRDIINARKALASEVQSLDSMFEQVPKLQACSRGVTVAFEAYKHTRSSGSKKLSNGQTVHLYSEPLCADEALLNYIQRINSY